MSTPVIERPGTSGGGRPRPQTRRTAPAVRVPSQRGPREGRKLADQRRRSVARENTGRAKFVLVVMILLVVGLVTTLWLSTAAAADSYALQDARQRNAALTEQSEALRKDVSVLDSPGSLAERAAAQGMVPVSESTRLVVAADGKVDVVGEPSAAQPIAPPPPPAPGVPPAPVAPGTSDPSDPNAAGGDAAAAAGARPGGAPQAEQPPVGDGAAHEVPVDTRAAGRD